MRLLHSSRLELKSFISDGDTPPYAILSHTWGEGEVSLQDWQGLPSVDLKLKKGYSKIQRCCEQAQKDGLDWTWVDTCCIDKTSSAELSEAINSMFRWYQDAKVCYAFLSDVPDCTYAWAVEMNLTKSRWFGRGWTLQELIAPANLVFFSADWSPVGTKSQLHKILSSITGIEKRFLDSKNLELASVAKRMSWASSRKTSRIEDIAYSMLGILGVTMDPQYGEGVKAFLRLQRTILEGPRDESIFAWTTSQQGLKCYSSSPPWMPSSWGLLAPSPDCFRNSRNVVIPPREHREEREYGWTQNGVHFKVPQKSGTDVTNWLGLPRKQVKFALNCWVDDGSDRKPTVVLHLTSQDGINYVRVRCDTLSPTLGAKPSSNRVMKIDQLVRRPLTVGQPTFTLSRTGQPSVENPYADAPRTTSRLQATNAALLTEIGTLGNRGS